MTMFITQVLLRPQNLGNDKTDKVVQFLVGGVYNPKNLGNDKMRGTHCDWCLRPQKFR